MDNKCGLNKVSNQVFGTILGASVGESPVLEFSMFSPHFTGIGFGTM